MTASVGQIAVELALSALVGRWTGTRIVTAFGVPCEQMGRRRKKIWWLCVVVKDLRDVAKVYGRRHRAEGARTVAFVRCHQSGQPDRDGCLGIIVLPATKGLGAGLVAHEVCHAAIFCRNWQTGGHLWKAPRGKGAWPYSGESLCHHVGNMMREMTNQLFARGVWK